MNRLYLLAHTDDEVFCLPFLSEPGVKNFVVYLTLDKSTNGVSCLLPPRYFEMQKATQYISKFTSIHSTFYENLFSDGRIYKDFKNSDFIFLRRSLREFEIDEIISLEFEGGHQDHDFVAIVAVLLGEQHQLKVKLCPAYCGTRFGKSLFKVMKPPPKNRVKVPQKHYSAIRAVTLIAKYRSQSLTWLGLGPATFWKYLFGSFYFRESFSLKDFKKHRICLYESRARASQDDVHGSIQSLILNIKQN